MMTRLALVMVMVGALAGAGWVLQRDPELRAQLARRAVQTLAAWLEVDAPSAPDGKVHAPGRVGVPLAARQAPAPSAAVQAAEPKDGPRQRHRFVDRSEKPSSLERVAEDDRVRLESLIAERMTALGRQALGATDKP